MEKAHAVLVRNLREHSELTENDVVEIGRLTCTARNFKPNEDFIRQGDDPEVAALLVSGMVARYHLLRTGRRQYLSFHISGDLPDAQGLFIEKMDHGRLRSGLPSPQEAVARLTLPERGGATNFRKSCREKWRARPDSSVWPPRSEGGALSSRVRGASLFANAVLTPSHRANRSFRTWGRRTDFDEEPSAQAQVASCWTRKEMKNLGSVRSQPELNVGIGGCASGI